MLWKYGWPLLLVFALLAAGCGNARVRQTLCRLALRGDDPALGSGGLLSAELPDGTLVVGGSREHAGTLRIRLRRVTQDCRPVTSFGEDGTATILRPAHAGAGLDQMTATPAGDLLLAGTDGRRELVASLLPSGRLDRSFGRAGWARVAPREKQGLPRPTPDATSIAVSSAGAIFLGGDDEEAHCCVQDFVSELGPRGRPVASFGDHGSVVLRRFTGSYTTEVLAGPHGSAYALGMTIFSGCGGPTVVRLRSDGSLDRGFDSAVAHSVARVTPHQLLFVPEPVNRPPAGSLALIGQTANYCPGTAKHLHSRGLALGLLPSGRVDRAFGRDGMTPFPDAGYPFGVAAPLQTGSGRILALTRVADARSGAPNRATVRAFSTNGAVERFGRAGARFINLRRLPRTDNASVALLPAQDGGAWLVAGFPKEIDLIPVRP